MNESPDTESTNKRFREVGNAAWRSIVAVVIALALVVTVTGLGFLVYRQRITAEPFLLLVGIVAGFLLGRLDVIL